MFQWTTEVTAHWNQLCKCASQTRIVYQTREESCTRGNSLLGQLVYITLSTSKPILQEIHYFEEFLDRKKNVLRWKTCDVLNPHKWKTPYVLQNSPNHLRKKFMTNGKDNVLIKSLIRERVAPTWLILLDQQRHVNRAWQNIPCLGKKS